MPRKFLKKKNVVEEKKPEEIKVESVFTEEMIQEESPKKRKFPGVKISKQIFIYIGIILLVIAAVGASGLFYFKYQEALKLSEGIAGAATEENEIRELLEEVGRLAELPQGETPTIATVSDINELSGQEFFKNAKNGDKVLIYQGAQTAYLYRPESGKIVNIGPVASSENSASGAAQIQTESTPTPVATPKLLLLNGTTTTGLTRTAELDITTAGIDVEVLDRDNTNSNKYEESIVVDVKGSFKANAEEIARSLGGQLAPNLPTGEEWETEADIIIILGSKYAEFN